MSTSTREEAPVVYLSDMIIFRHLLMQLERLNLTDVTPRSDQFFFRQSRTLSALRELATLDSIVIYCGAGVSIDRTGVSWSQLIHGVFSRAKENREDTRKAETRSVEYLLGHLPDRQSASIVIQSFAKKDQSDNDFLGTKLKEILYEKAGWNRGVILRNLIQLAFAAAGWKRDIVIVTTNYDIYIETEFVSRRNDLIKLGLPPESAPGLSRRLYKADGTYTLHEIVAAGTDAAVVELIYLHGRVDDHGAVEGNIVLTEHSYAQSWNLSTAILEAEFNKETSGLLVVGASLTDEPLIAALANTRHAAPHRYALITSPAYLDDPLTPPASKEAPPVAIDANTVGEAVQLRGKHLGITILQPISHNQSAQFLEELRLSLTTATAKGDPMFYARAKNRVSYPERLATWHTTWDARSQTQDPQWAFDRLRDGLERAIALVLEEKGVTGEGLRAEVWARRHPSSKDRTMSLWANSSGPIVDRDLLRKEEIIKSSMNASVQTFLAGRPQLVSLEHLHYDDRSSRWKTFLSVPIFIWVPAETGQDADGGNVPAGIVTLMSDRYVDYKGTDTSQVSVFDDKVTMDDLNAIKGILIGLGREILGLEDL